MKEEVSFNAVNILKQGDYRELAKLKKQYHSWQTAWRNLAKQNQTLINPEKEWQKLKKLGCDLILITSLRYPPLLKEIPWPPFGLYTLGPIKNIPSLAVVGTRKATQSGQELSKNFSKSLAAAGLSIVSGLALGIDVKSHEGALEARGHTVAVLATGLDYFYPRQNERFAKKILEGGGVIVSEYPLGSPAFPGRFIERNRIVSGLSQGVLVIEAPLKSGSLATARFAVEQNREVFVIPGPVSHPNFQGSHELIRQGATLVTKPEDILEIIAPHLVIKNQSPTLAEAGLNNPEFKIIFDILAKSGKSITIDKIIELSKLDAEVVNRTLSFLMIKKSVKETENGYTV